MFRWKLCRLVMFLALVALFAQPAYAYIPYCYECETNMITGANVCYVVSWDGYDICFSFGGNACGYSGLCYVG